MVRALVRSLVPAAVVAFALAGCTADADAPADEHQVRMSSDALKGGGGKHGGGSNSCTGTPAITISPSTLAVGTTIGSGGTFIMVSGTGFCGTGAVLTGISALPLCYSGEYVSNGVFSNLTFPYSGFGSAANEHYTFDAPGTYTVGVWAATVNADGSVSTGALLATAPLTIQ